MKLAVFITLVTVLQAAANGFAQTITLEAHHMSLVQAMRVVQQQSGHPFFLTGKDLANLTVSASIKDLSLASAMDKLLKGKSVDWVLKDETIIVKHVTRPNRQQMESPVVPSVIQDKSMTGRVVDEAGSPLQGVTVTIRGTTKATTTDERGNYTLTVPEGASTLVFTIVGFESIEKPIGNLNTVNATLIESISDLDEVVVTGYTSEKKGDIVGSVSIVNTNDLQTTPTGNITSQLQGRLAGVTVSSDGSLDGGAKVRIRGFGSFSGSDPLYIIDGIPVGGDRSGNTSSAIDNLNPNDIETMQVLKDAAAASIYGARAANGVVIITTKGGQKGATKLSVDTYYGTNYVSSGDFPDMLNAKENGELYWRGLQNAWENTGNLAYEPGVGVSWYHDQYGSGLTPVIPEYILAYDNGAKLGGAALEKLRITDPAKFDYVTNPANYSFARKNLNQIVRAGDTDWFDEIYNPAPTANVQIGAQGGGESGNYALSLNYFKRENTAAKTNAFERYSIRSNSVFNLHKNFRMGENLQITYGEEKGDGAPSSSGPHAAWAMQPLVPVYDILGNPAGSAAPKLGASTPSRNQVTESWRNRFDKRADYGILGNVFGEVDILNGLTGRTSFGLNYLSRKLKDVEPTTVEHKENTNANSIVNESNFFTQWNWTNTLNYNKTFASRHNVNVLLGTEAIKTNGENLMASRTGIALVSENDPNFQVLDAATGTQTNSGYFFRNSLYSVFGRADYSFDGKYFVNASIRRDKSSKFSSAHRVGYFPAVAVGWRVSSERFMHGFDFINDLKLRASYGVIGNESGLPAENQYNVYVSSLAEGYPMVGDNKSKSDSYSIKSIGNFNARWERNTTTNIGLDASMFNNSLSFTLEVYNKQTKDLLVLNQGPLTGSAAIQPYINAGDMENRGIDVSLTKQGKIGGGFGYNLGVFFSKYKNKVTRVLDNPLASIIGSTTRIGGMSPSLTRVGSPIGSYYGYQLDGFFNTQAEVDAFNSTFNPGGTTTPWIPPQVGRWKIKDVNGDDVINADDRTIIGSPHPDFQASFNLALDYKNFDLGVFVFWNQGGQLFNLSRYNVDFNTMEFNRSARMLHESWTPALGNEAKLPMVDILDTYSNKNITDYYLEDASYLRLKTVQLGYTFPSNLIQKIRVSRLRVYCQGQNLFTAKNSNTSVLDPDGSLNGSDISMGVISNTLPTPKQIIVGLSIGL